MKSITVTIFWDEPIELSEGDIKVALDHFFYDEEDVFIVKPYTSNFPLTPIITDNPSTTTTVDFKNIH